MKIKTSISLKIKCQTHLVKNDNLVDLEVVVKLVLGQGNEDFHDFLGALFTQL